MEDKNETANQAKEIVFLIKNKELDKEQLLHVALSIRQLKEYIKTDPVLHPVRKKVGMISGVIVLSTLVIIGFVSGYLESCCGIDAFITILIAVVLGLVILIRVPSTEQIADRIVKSKNKLLKAAFIPKNI